MMRGIDARKAKRLMNQMGMHLKEIPDVEKVIIQTTSEEIIIEKPIVSVMELQNQKVFQITGGNISEKTSEKTLEIPEEDMHLVAQQAGVSLERAKEALKQTNGDLAQAILLLTSKNR